MQRTPGAVLLALLALLVAASATATADSAAAAAAALEPAADLSGDWAQPATSADLADDYEYHYDDMVAAQAVGSEPAPPLNPPTPPPPVTGASHVPPAEAADAEWLAALESSRAADEALRRDLDGWQVSYEYAEEASGVAGLGSGISPKSSVSTPAAAAGMLAELTSDIAELAAAVEAAASVGGAGANGSAAEVVEGLPPVSVPTLKIELPSGWSAELMYSRNESSYGVSSRRAWWPGAGANASERGAFDIRLGSVAKRRLVLLPDKAVQEVTEMQYYFSISGVALVTLTALMALFVLHRCFVEYGEESEEEEEMEEGRKGGDTHAGGERAGFIRVIQESGYEKL